MSIIPDIDHVFIGEPIGEPTIISTFHISYYTEVDGKSGDDFSGGAENIIDNQHVIAAVEEWFCLLYDDGGRYGSIMHTIVKRDGLYYSVLYTEGGTDVPYYSHGIPELISTQESRDFLCEVVGENP